MVSLIQNSPTLSEERKAMILKAIEHLSDEKAEKLIQIFVSARQRYDEIAKKYDGAALDLKKQYLEKANEFTSKELTELFHEWELAEQAKEELVLEAVEKEIEKIPEE